MGLNYAKRMDNIKASEIRELLKLPKDQKSFHLQEDCLHRNYSL